MRLETAEIDRYGPLFDCRPPCDDGLTIVSGPNESGKTLFLEGVLQLLDPAVCDVMRPPPRVDEPPAGRIQLRVGSEYHELGGETALSDVSPIDPPHLQNVFVVRDNDLRLPDDGAYYASLVEQLGDIHTTEIATVRSALIERGRLTPTRYDVSGGREHDDARGVRSAARALADEIREYAATIEEEGLDELERRRLETKSELARVREELDRQRTAERVSERERLADRLATYRSAVAELDELADFDRETLEELRDIDRAIDHAADDLADVEAEIESARAELEAAADRRRAIERERTELERRREAVSEVSPALEEHRNRRDRSAGAERRCDALRRTAAASLVGAGLSGGAGAATGSVGALAIAGLLLVGSAIAGGLYRRASGRLAAAETSRRRAVEAARDAGLDVEGVDDVAPAVESFEAELESAREREARAENRAETLEETLGELEAERSRARSAVRAERQRRDRILAEAGVEDVDGYATAVERREEATGTRERARQSLIDAFGDPAANDPGERARRWEKRIDAMVEDADPESIDASDYDEATLESLERRERELDAELEELNARLADHEDRLETFRERALEIDSRPFVGEQVSLDSRSTGGLAALADDLDEVVSTIESDAELSRKAIAVFDAVEEREERKLTELFAPDGTASQTFAALTDGAYGRVSYDPDDHDLVVHRESGRTLSPDQLSQGTRDQLYFATRVSLATQLLGGEPGFLLLDDPFLAADPDRLRNGFRTLRRLADDGWQILYLTAKAEVSERMVESFDLDRVELDAIGSV